MSEINILIVEDQAIVAEDIASRLEKMNYAIADIVASGEEAILAANRNHPDLILMDIMLQGEIGGIVAADTIYRELNIPVIYLTAYADDRTMQQAKDTYPFGYILKPFKDKELQAAIEIARSRHDKETQVEQDLIVANSQKETAEKETQQKSDYLCMVSHDLRNPLSNIKAWAQLCNFYLHKWSPEKKQQALNKIEEAANEMNLMLEDVLTLARVDSSDKTFNPQCLDVVSVCENLIDKFRYIYRQDYSIAFKFVGENTPASFDEILIWHLLNNILSNAIKYSPKGSEVSLTLIGETEQMCFQIQDHGIGIPEKNIPHLFESFKRGSNVGKVTGTGLGLAIVKRVVDLHQGTIEINSQENQGTTVIVKLPIKR
jgi:signal transduction histidine kinase